MRSHLARRVDGVALLDLFILAGVAAVLVTRAYLAMTGYPQVGNGVLHIAHAVWGGLLMALAVMAALALVGRAGLPAIAVVGGVGFGLFVDEIGKFITRDVNYFFRPAAAIIYLSFMLMYFGARLLVGRPATSGAEWLANAAELAGGSAGRALTPSERGRLTAMLAKAPADHPLRRALAEYAAAAPVRPERAPGHVRVLARAAAARFRALVRTRRFRRLVAVVAVVYAILAVAQIATLVVAPGDLVQQDDGGSDVVQWAATVATLAQGALTIVAVALLRRSRLRAYRWLERAILVNILLVQVFLFAENQFSATVGMAVSLLALAVVRTLITFEERERMAAEGLPAAAPGTHDTSTAGHATA